MTSQREISAITARRRGQVLALSGEGLGPAAIGEELGVSPDVVREDRKVLREQGHEIVNFSNRTASYTAKRRASVLDLVTHGLTPAQIAERCGVPSSTVHSDIATLRRQGYQIPRYRTGTSWVDGQARVIAAVPPHVARKLDVQADARGMTKRELATAILTAVAGRDRVIEVLLTGGGDDDGL